MSLIDSTWTCKECGAWNAAYLSECGKCLEMKENKVRQYRSRQGRSDKQYEDSAKILALAGVLILGAVLGYVIVCNIILNVFS